MGSITFVTNTYEQTRLAGELLARNLRGGDIVCLDGDLGAGKTAFCSGIAKYYGAEDEVSSPTFTILQEYKVNITGDRPCNITGDRPCFSPRIICHFDAYRLDDENSFYDLGFDEYLGSEDTLCLIEWASIVKGAIPDEAIQINIRNLWDDNYAEISKTEIGISGVRRFINISFSNGDLRMESLRDLLVSNDIVIL